MKTAGNTVLITGGGSGIGLALARAFVAEGNTVIACGRSSKRLEEARAVTPGLDIYVCDVSDAEQQDRLVAELVARYPTLNILINNAGIQFNYGFDDLQDHDFQVRQEIAVNLTGPVLLTRKLLPQLTAQPEAAVINVTSALALVPKQDASVYCATKAALSSHTVTLRYQLEGTRCKVFEIMPPLVDTDMTAGRGSGKISAAKLAAEALRGIRADRFEIRIGRAKLLSLLNRMTPALAAKIVRNS